MKIKQSDIILVFISLCIVSAAWIVFNVLHAATDSKINGTLQQQIQPISPSFNTKAIDALRTRQLVNPQTTAATPSATPIPTLPINNSTSTNSGATTP